MKRDENLINGDKNKTAQHDKRAQCAVVIKDIFDFIESVSKQCGAENEV